MLRAAKPFPLSGLKQSTWIPPLQPLRARPCQGNTMDIEALNGNKGCAVISGNTVYDPEIWPQGAGNSAILLFQSASTMNLEGAVPNANTQLAATNTATDTAGGGANDFETF